MVGRLWPHALLLVALAVTTGPASAEVNEIKITKQPGLLFTPMLLMEQHKLVEKHAGSPELVARVGDFIASLKAPLRLARSATVA